MQFMQPEMLFANYYHLCNFKNVKNAYVGLLLLVKLQGQRDIRFKIDCRGIQASTCNVTKSNTPAWVFFTFLKLRKWQQIAQSTHIYLNLSFQPELQKLLQRVSYEKKISIILLGKNSSVFFISGPWHVFVILFSCSIFNILNDKRWCRVVVER